MEKTKRSISSRGQSLVEFALTLPLLLMITAAVLEVGNLLSVYNRLETAVRDGARAGAAGQPDILLSESLARVQLGRLPKDPNRIHIWFIRPRLNWNSGAYEFANSTGPFPWGTNAGIPVWRCAYGNVAPCPETEENEDSYDSSEVWDQPPVPASAVLNEINEVNNDELDDEQLTVIVIHYEASTILNLSFFALPDGRVPLTTYAVFRQEVSQEAVEGLTNGCSAYALALDEDQLKNPPVTGPGPLFGETYTLGPNEFHTLKWRTSGSAWQDGMVPPGNSELYEEPATNPADTSLHLGDRVEIENNESILFNKTYQSQNVITNHINQRRALRVILFDTKIGQDVVIKNFAIIFIAQLDGSNITVQFQRYEGNCGVDPLQ